MPILSLIDTGDIESWETGMSDGGPGTVTHVTIRAEAAVQRATFTTKAMRMEQGATGVFSEQLHLGGTHRTAGQAFRIASVFTSDDGRHFFSLTDETRIFALAFTGDAPPTGTPIRLRTTDRRLLETALDKEQDALICFTPNALILCENGPRQASDIQTGDKVRTADRGLQEVRWQGETTLSHAQLVEKPHLRPIILRKNSIAAGVPARDLAVSPNHRILLNNWRAELLFGEKEVLAPAGALINEDTISRSASSKPVQYIHLKFIRHEILFANGLKTESFHPAQKSIAALSEPDREALFDGFPALRSDPDSASGPAARRLLKPAETKLLVEKSSR